MHWAIILLILIGSLIVLMATGFPVAFCFLAINVVGAIVLWGWGPGLEQLALTMFQSVSTFVFLPIAMFIFLGTIVFHSGMALRAIDVIDAWMGRLPGRLGLLAVLASTLFSTLSGSTVATTAMLGEALTPEMERRGYKRSMSIGPIMGSGGLAMLIPPSSMAITWAAVAEVSVGRILLSGFIPGLIIAFLYATYIVGRCWLQPSIAPAYNVTPIQLSKKLAVTLKYVLPLAIIVFSVTGVIIIGVATPSEAAALGGLSAVILASIYGKLSWDLIKHALRDTLKTTVMILLIISTSKGFGQILAFTGATRELVELSVAIPLSPILVVAVMMLVLLFMGTFMAALPQMMITLPIFLPVIKLLGFDPVWFGLLFLLNIEMDQSTPPFGLLLFVMKGVAPKGTTMGEIWRAGIPFLACDAICMVLIMCFPVLALWLPNLIIG
ncbi:TRAP transporter large permease [bacterium]|nr:TRAP transporter large permease [bacterium]